MRRLIWIICCLLVVLFTAISWSAVQGKSATFDEPYHATAAWVQLYRRDFRIDPQNGALWHDWCALASGPHAMSADFQVADFRDIPVNLLLQWDWCTRTLYRTTGNDAIGFVNHQRGMSLLLGVMLAVLTASWAGRVGGKVAAPVALALFTFDPNFLAHSPLVKNDVPFALVYVGFAMAVWRAGRKLTLPGLLGVALMSGIAVTVKSTGVLLGPLLVLLFAARALSGASWWMLGGDRSTRPQRMIFCALATVLVAGFTWVFIWAVYDFRFAPSPGSLVLLDMQTPTRLAIKAEFVLRTGDADPTDDRMARQSPSWKVKLILWSQQHRLLPQAFLNGLLYQYEANLLRNNYLLGDVSLTGKWQYYPLAMLFKTPTATLVTAALTFLIFPWLARGSGRSTPESIWNMACLILPPIWYLLLAMFSNVNAGIRHVLVVYPFVYIAIGCAIAVVCRRWPLQRTKVFGLVGLLGLGLAIETLAAFPNFIPFFNIPSGGSRGGLALLGDSNLDWGQDLPLLALWQRQHPDVRLYLSYFGMTDPAYYQIRYTILPGGYSHGPAFAWPDKPGAIAISASNLQGFLLQPKLYYQFYEQFRHLKPVQVLGGSIYIFQFPPVASDKLAGQ